MRMRVSESLHLLSLVIRGQRQGNWRCDASGGHQHTQHSQHTVSCLAGWCFYKLLQRCYLQERTWQQVLKEQVALTVLRDPSVPLTSTSHHCHLTSDEFYHKCYRCLTDKQKADLKRQPPANTSAAELQPITAVHFLQRFPQWSWINKVTAPPAEKILFFLPITLR